MAYSYVRYTGNGSTTNYTFSFPTISTDHIKVRVNGTLVTNWSFLSASTIQFAAAPANAAVIEIRRETPKDSSIVNFTDGSVLLERDLDLLATWQLYVAQETEDDLEDTIRVDSLGRLDAQNRRIINVADPVAAQDAVTKNWLETTYTSELDAIALAAASSATAADTSATNAASSASAAAASYDSFDDRYLGAKSAAPTVDNDGQPLITGTIYWDTPSSQMFTWNGTSWRPTFLIGNTVRSVVTATAGQTVVATPTYLIGSNTLQVFVNGVKVLLGADYTETTQNSITFVSGLTLGGEVELIAQQAFAVDELRADLASAAVGKGSSLVSYLPEGTGAVATTVQTKLRESVSVKDFGAVGDGVANDTAAIQAAIDYAGTEKVSVYVPAGVYVITDTLTSLSYFSICGDPHNYTSGDNDPAGERYGSVLLFTGSINDPVVYADMENVTAFALRNLSIRVASAYNNVGVHLLGSSWTTQGGTFDCEIDNVAVIREGTIGPQNTNAVGVYFDATDVSAVDGRAFFGSKVNNYYAFNLNTGLKLAVATNTAGTDNFINSNIFSNIKMYQTFIGIELTGATGSNAIWRNTFSSIFIQGGLGTGGSNANSQVAAAGVVADNVFVNTIVWDSPSDVFLSVTHWKQNTNVQSFGHFPLDIIAQGKAVFGGGGKVSGGATTQAKGIGAYNASTGQFAVYDVNNESRRVNFGYDPTLEAGYIQAVKAGVANEPLLLNPNGGSLNIFPVNAATPLMQNAMVFDYVSDTRIDLKFKGSDNVVRSITFTLAP